MTTTDDTSALKELLWDVITDIRDAHPRSHRDAPTYEIVTAVLPIIRKAQADAWDEGQSSGWDEAQCTWLETGSVGDGWKHSTDPNPYRAQEAR